MLDLLHYVVIKEWKTLGSFDIKQYQNIKQYDYVIYQHCTENFKLLCFICVTSCLLLILGCGADNPLCPAP